MKYIKLLQLVVLSTLIIGTVSSCGDDDPETPNIRVGFSYSPDNPIAGEEVSFTNASTGGTTYDWDFGDGNTSTEENPTHIYEADGDYTVTLMVDGNSGLTFDDNVTVGPPTPEISFTPNPIEVGVPVTFSASVYNPTNATIDWAWQFPAEGWISDDLDETGAGTGESITVTFVDPNANLPVSVTGTIGSDELTRSQTINVNDQLAKTLWIAEKGGNIWSKKIYLNGEAQLEDSGIGSGSHPLTLDYENDRLYVFDAGSTLTFSANLETTPGQIFSIGNDNSYTTHVTFSNQNYDDAFFGSVDGEDIIFTDRRNDITIIPTSTTGAEWGDNGADGNPEQFPFLVQNNQLGYYSAWAGSIEGYSGPSYGFGALNGTVKRIDDVYWWAKNSNHKGLYRFMEDDIYPIGTTPTTAPDEGAILGDYAVRAFEIDHEGGKIYFSSNNPTFGFYVANLDGSNVQEIDMSPTDGEGGTTEGTYITGIAIDNESGYVYWAYRGPTDADLEANPLQASGIKRYKLDGTGEVEYFIEGVEAYGLAIDDTKR